MSALPLTPHPDPPPDPKVARAALSRLLESSEFQASNRLRHFIEFVVEETLRGRADQIKAYVIAVQVFGRPASFDPSSDNIVRVEARRLRAALDRYYESGGASDPLRIAMPTGGYRAVFERRTRSFPTHRERTEALPALAIVPLRNLGPQSDRFFAAGLAAELGVAFHKLRILRTVSLPPVAGPETEEAELRRACAEVGVRFVLHGSLQRAGPRVRVGIQLLDVDSGEHLWADLFDRKLEMEGVLDVQQEIVRRVASQVGDYHEGAVHQTLIREALQSTRCMSAYEAVLRGRYYSDRVTRRDHARAIAALDLAVQLDPGYAAAWADLGGVRASGYAHALADGSRTALLEQALAEAQRARDLDATLDRVHWNLGFVHLNLRNRAGVLRSAESLIALDPPPTLMAIGGWLLAVAGQWKRGLALVEEQLDVLRFSPGWLPHVFFLDAYGRGDHEKALGHALGFDYPGLAWGPVERCAALARLGRVADARGALEQAVKIRPDLLENPRRFLDCYILDDDVVEDMTGALSLAGLRS